MILDWDMTFDKLLSLVSSVSLQNGLRVCADSRLVEGGDIFVAIKGYLYDGHDFIEQAVAKGAEYVVSQKSCVCNGAEVIVVNDSAEALGLLAQASEGNPSSELVNLAVTGTNGKTTVAFLVRSIMAAAGELCGLIGTVFYDTGSAASEASLTTPDGPAIATMSREMLNNGAKYMVIETSSHSLRQNRLAGIKFKAAAFTNLSGDHLDYHKTEANYLAAKSKLFEQLAPNSVAVLNKQSPAAARLAKVTRARQLWYAVSEPADISARIESMDIDGTVFTLEYAGQKGKVKTSLPGLYNVSNHLAAAGLCLVAGADLQTIAAGLEALEGVPGRLERINCGQDFSVLVDYAHTDDSLRNVLSTLRGFCAGKLMVVFGCGGDRDRTKRRRMAKVAQQLADFIIVTSDNPRTEQLQQIINDIVAGFDAAGCERIKIEPDRRAAIELAIESAGKDDIVLIAGKGHETYQIIGEEKFDFSDKAVAQEYLQKR